MGAADYWDDEAQAFDDQPDHGLRDPHVRAAWSDLLQRLLPEAPSRVADIGCGTGSLSLLMAEAGHRVSGLDIAPRMLALAKLKLEAAGLEAEFRVGDGAIPPFETRTFDAVVTRHVLWAMPDPDAALRAWLELLAPGGRLILVEGRWWTGSGMNAAAVSALVLAHRADAQVIELEDPSLWGGPIRDERFVVLSLR